MADFAKLRVYLSMIREAEEKGSMTVVSLGVASAVQEAIKELDRLDQENCPNCGYPDLSGSRDDEPEKLKRRSAPEYPPATPKHLRDNTLPR
jgi:hypothetical protein